MSEIVDSASGKHRVRRFLFWGTAATAIVYGIAGALYTASIIAWDGLLTFALILGGVGGGIAGAIGGALGGMIAGGVTQDGGDPGRALLLGGSAAIAVSFGLELAVAASYSRSLLFSLNYATAGLAAALFAGSGWYLFRRRGSFG